MSTFLTPDYIVKQYDTARTLAYTFSIGGTYVDLTNATVSLNILTPANTTINRNGSIVSAVSGSVSYNLVSTDTAIAGLNRLEFKVKFIDGTILRIPSDGYIFMQVNPAIGT